MTGIHSARIEKIRDALDGAKLDGALFLVQEGLGWEDCFYLSGFRGSSAALLITEKESVLLTDGRYITQARAQTRCDVIDQGKRAILDALSSIMEKRGVKTVGIVPRKMLYSSIQGLTGSGAAPADFSSHMTKLRRSKEPCEIDFIRRAAGIASRSLEETVEQTEEGVTESGLAAMLEYRIRMSGEEPWGEHGFIVASGENSALPHAVPGPRSINSGEWAVVDYGVRTGGYVCDLTRILSFGSLSPWMTSIHDILAEAREAALNVLSAGVPAAEVDRAARNVIEASGYGEYFNHGLGHGIGLELHEPPVLSFRSLDILTEGDVVTVEPGIYVPGKGGARIEDDYLITPSGYEHVGSFLPTLLRC
ncbi:MAG: aminopeptidase P family protein [Synergistota bacterium]|nr:aminopeptidase P family protein [Synergistota bacterium]